MASTGSQALFAFGKRYIDTFVEEHGTLPCNHDMADMPSSCLQGDADSDGQWQPVALEPMASFDNVEQGIELELHNDIKAFYCSQYSADMDAIWRGNSLTLLQVWNQDDFVLLQENILGHLVMQRRLKLQPTVFIATTDDEMEVVSICNLSGNVLLEELGTKNRQVLAVSLAEFLDGLVPAV